MNPPACLVPHDSGTCLRVKVQPRASRNAILGMLGDELKISITAPPVDSAANEALRRFLSELFKCPPGAVELLRGRASRHKVFLLRGLRPEAILQRLTTPPIAAAPPSRNSPDRSSG
jgi:uncharacterized protein (TIGR00251 family)